MLEYAAMLETIANTDRTLEPIKTMMLSTIADAVELERERAQDKTAIEVLLTSDTFFRKATKDALARIETLEKEIDVAKALIGKYCGSHGFEESHSAYCALVVWAKEE